MRKTLLFFILLCTKLSFAQVIDSFSDGDFTNNPTWSGTTSYFHVVDGVLSSNGPQATSTLYLSTPNSLSSNVAWEFYVNLGFDPSTTNYPRIYLISNQADLSATSGIQAYYLQLGSSSSAENFSLVKQNGATSTTLLTLPDKSRANATSVSVRVRVERTATGRWDIYTDFTGGTNLSHDGFVVDNSYTSTSYFGVYCRYSTASRYNLFKFDDFKIESYIDNLAPKVTNVKSLDDQNFEITFDESIDVTTAQNTNNYTISNLGNPSQVLVLGSNKVKLTFNNAAPTGNYTLSSINIADVKGNVQTSASSFNFFHIKSYIAQKGDVVINEIMAAPQSSATLNQEYIELYNTTEKYIIITGWKYKDASTSIATFSADTLAPKSYRIICKTADVPLFTVYGKTLGISPWPTLNNDNDDLSLTSVEGNLIDAVSYQDTWYRDSNKKTGYALELINPTSPCGGAFNWTASTASLNGTPGTQNAVYDPTYIDNVAPRLIGVKILSNTQVQVDFDKLISASMLTDVNNYSINNGIGKPNAVSLNGTGANSVILDLNTAILPNTENLLTVTNLANCGGVLIDANYHTAWVILTEPIKPNDILITEILFNPNKDGVDFVEIYNNSNRILNLNELSISNKSASGSAASKRIVTANSVFIRPQQYWVFSSNSAIVKSQYKVKNPSQMTDIANFPAYTNTAGTAALWNISDELVDTLYYNEKMHHVLLTNVKGVSLERVSLTKNANEQGNLQSAAELVGFATPTYKNSQAEDLQTRNNIVLQHKTFSPDHDGFEDELKVDYHFKESGNLLTVNVYDQKGYLIRRLMKNSSMPTQGSFIWDGLDDNNQPCKIGIYVLKFKVLNPKGWTDNYTKTVVLAGKLN